MATIITKNSSTASAVPSAGSLTQGELAVNVTDKKLYTKDNGGNVVVVGQEPLISGTNIKTVGGTSLLGSGDIAVGTGDVTLTGTQTLTNKTLSTGTSLSATVTGTDNLLTRVMLQDTGWDFHDSGTTNALDYVNGSVQRWAPNTGAQTLTISNWPPSGAMGELLIQGVNLGAATITWPTINWIKADGTTTTTFSSNGVTLQSSGTDWVLLWTRDGGTTIFGKVVR